MIYTLGYNGIQVSDLHRKIMEANYLLVDVRLAPWSRNPDWRRDNLRQVFGERYLHIHAFGNENYKTGGPIALKDPAAGLEKLLAYPGDWQPVLLCQCRDYQTCHRLPVARYIQQGLLQTVWHPITHWTSDDLQPVEQLRLWEDDPND